MFLRAALLVGLVLSTSSLRAAPPIKALIVDGQNNHDWKATTPILKKTLEEAGLFAVDVATSPAGKDMSGFKPKFSDYKVVVSNYNGVLWSAETQAALVDFVKQGGGLVVVHAANNSFETWKEYNEMIGLGWRGPGFGERVTVDDQGKIVRTAKGQGPGAGHGSQHPFAVVVRDAEHPITKGLPNAWMHAQDELYHGQRGPAVGMSILATAFADKTKGGTAAHEPMLWTIPYGQGRVFVTVLGHSTGAMQCAGFQFTLTRGSEWAATGQVTQTKVPEDFPTVDKVSLRK